MIYIVCFDISDNSARERVGRVLLARGNRVQRSVFEIKVADTSELEGLREELSILMDDETDLRFYRLCSECQGCSSTLDGTDVAAFPALVVC